MQKTPTSQSGLFNPHVFLAFGLCGVAALLVMLSWASTPSSGTVSPTNPQVSYTGGPFLILNATDSSTGVTCDQAHPCDDFALTVDLPADYATTNPNDLLKFEVGWNDPTRQQDLDVYLLDSQNNYARLMPIRRILKSSPSLREQAPALTPCACRLPSLPASPTTARSRS